MAAMTSKKCLGSPPIGPKILGEIKQNPVFTGSAKENEHRWQIKVPPSVTERRSSHKNPAPIGKVSSSGSLICEEKPH
jgi:hypothetical protein